MIQRRCSISLSDGTPIERVIKIDTYYSVEIAAMHYCLADNLIPHRVSYSDKYVGTIMFDSIPPLGDV